MKSADSVAGAVVVHTNASAQYVGSNVAGQLMSRHLILQYSKTLSASIYVVRVNIRT